VYREPRDPVLAGNELNNREWATLVWLGAAMMAALWRKPSRPLVLNLVRSAALSLFGLLAVGLWAWTAGIAFLGEQAHLWTHDLVKDTVVWAIGPTLVLVFRLNQASKDPKFFRRAFLETVKLSVLVEFYLNVRVLGFVQELVLLPVATVVALLAQFAGTDQKYRRVKQVFDLILLGIGVALLAYVTITLATSWRQEDPWRDVRELALPIWLTLGVVPYIYGVSLFFTYQGAFRRIAFSSKDVAAVRRAKLALLLGLNVRSHEVGKFYDPWTTRLTDGHNFTDARRIVRQFRRREPTETAGDDQD
jgi:hypothetical protein